MCVEMIETALVETHHPSGTADWNVLVMELIYIIVSAGQSYQVLQYNGI